MRLASAVYCSSLIILAATALIPFYGLGFTHDNFQKRGLVRDIVEVLTSRNSSSLVSGNTVRGLESHGVGSSAHYEPSFASFTVGLRAKHEAKDTRKRLKAILRNIISLKKDLKSRDEFSNLPLEKKRNEFLRVTTAWNAAKQDYQELTDDQWANLAAWTKSSDAGKLQQFHDDIYEEFLHTKSFILDYRRTYERELRSSARYALDGGTFRESMAETQALGLSETRLK